MSKVEIKSTGEGKYSVKVDGQEIATSLASLSIHARDPTPVVTLEVVASELEIDLDEAEARIVGDEPRDFGFYKLKVGGNGPGANVETVTK